MKILLDKAISSQIDNILSLVYYYSVPKIAVETVENIRILRQLGYTIPEISNSVSVSKTTVLRYIKGVEILPEYLKKWAAKRGGSHKRKLVKEEKAFIEGIKFIGDLTYKEKLLFLAAIYWGEGNKKDFEIINSNPDLVRLFVYALRELFNLTDERIKVSIRIYEDLDEQKCLQYWSELLNIPKSKFGRTDVLFGRKSRKLQYGMCRVRVLMGGDLLKQIMGINKAVSQSFVPIAQRIEHPGPNGKVPSSSLGRDT